MKFKMTNFLVIIFLVFSVSNELLSADKKSKLPKSKERACSMNKNIDNSSLKIAYVNINKIITFEPSLLPHSSAEWQKRYALLQDSLNPIELEIKAIEEEFEKGRKEFESLQKSGLASNEALQKKYEEMAKLEFNLRKRIQERDQYAQDEVKSIHSKILPSLEKAIHEIKVSRGYNFILRSEFVIEADAEFDITAEVLNLMNKQHSEELKAAEQKKA